MGDTRIHPKKGDADQMGRLEGHEGSGSRQKATHNPAIMSVRGVTEEER